MKNPIPLLAAAFMTALSLGAQSYAQSDSSSWDYYWNNSQDKALTTYNTKTDLVNQGRSNYWGIEGAYGINAHNDKIDLAGALLTYSAYDSAGPERKHQFIFQTGFLKGNRTYWLDSNTYQKEVEQQIPVIAGYNYNLAIHERVLLYAGFRGGIVFGTHKINVNEHHDRATDVAALFGGGCGIKFIVTPRMDVILGYDYQRTFTRYHGQNDYNGYHYLKAGVAFGF